MPGAQHRDGVASEGNVSLGNHEISIHEPWDYQGRKQIRTTGIGIVHGSDKDYYLLNLLGVIEINGSKAYQLIVSSRYADVSLDQVMTKKCAVGIAAINKGIHLSGGDSFLPSQVTYFAIGEIRRV
jgi:hypothetical protein